MSSKRATEDVDPFAADQFLGALRADPAPAFARSLHDRLNQQTATRGASGHAWPFARVAAAVAVLAAAGSMLTVPAVRASAMQFLSLFRAVNFVPVPVDATRADALTGGTIDLPRLVGEHIQVLEDSGPPLPVASVEAASQSAGFAVRLPATLPEDVRVTSIELAGPHAVRVVANVSRVNDALDALGISDLRAPDAIDGKSLTVRVPSFVRVTYEQRNWKASLSQALAPTVELPQGVDLALLGEIGLRVLGLPAAEAHDFARRVDWHTTLLVPVPAKATSFKQVEIGGHQGVMIEAPPSGEGPKRVTTAVLWSAAGRVYGLQGNLLSREILTMANSIR